MEVKLAYGEKQLKVKILPGAQVDTFTSCAAESTTDPLESGSTEVGEDVRAFLSGEPLLFVVNDGHRNTPTARILAYLDQIEDSLIDRAGFLVATGVHEAPTRDHLRTIFGPYLQRVQPRLSCHDALDLAAMSEIGVDSLGGKVFINCRVLEAPKIFAIGSVEPHYFAGYTGGRKLFFPGLCDFATVERNHNLASSLAAAPLRLDGNPVAEHLDELMGMLGEAKILAAQSVHDSQGRIDNLFIGPLETAFDEATRSARELFARRITDRYDVVISELLPPLDGNLYQVQKALENTQAAVVDGGTAVIVSACAEGIGSRYFFDLAAKWDRESNAPSDGTAAFGSHKLSRVNAMAERIDVRLYSELSDECVRRVFYEPLDDIDEFLKSRIQGRDSFRVAVVRDAGHTVLMN